MHNSNKEWEHNYQESMRTGTINLDHLTFDDVPDFAPSTASPKASCSGPKGSIGKAIRRRSRASKKAPTTLLTADANNFRALVQKFTGWNSSTPLQRAYKGPINLNFEQCSHYPKNLEQKKQKQVDHCKLVHEDQLDRSSVCRNINNDIGMGAAAFADLDEELFGQNPRNDHDHALTYDHGLDMDNFLGTADYSTVLLSETMDDAIWGYQD